MVEMTQISSTADGCFITFKLSTEEIVKYVGFDLKYMFTMQKQLAEGVLAKLGKASTEG